MKKMLGIMVIVGIGIASVAQASFVTDWDNWLGVTTVADAEDVFANERDIRELNHYYDGSTYHYFRMVFDGGSGTQLINGSTDYMINIDSKLGGQSAATSLYLASGLTGIDQIVDVHMGNATLFSSATPGHNHSSSNGANGASINFTITSLGSYDADAQGGTSFLEWKINKNVLPEQNFTVYGSSLQIGNATFDTTSGVSVIPEPASVLMIGFGGLVIAGYRRIRKLYGI